MDASDKVNDYINSHGGWHGDLLKELHVLIQQTAPELKEDFKWGVPVWTNSGLVCAISAFKDHVKINFFKGAYLPDPKGVINSGLDSKEHRSINFNQGDKIDKPSLKSVIKAASAYSPK